MNLTTITLKYYNNSGVPQWAGIGIFNKNLYPHFFAKMHS